MTVKKISRQADIATVFNADRENYKLQDVAFFSHGVVGKISLNYDGGTDIDLDAGLLGRLQADAFIDGGRIYSYACRTGVSVEDYTRGFDDEGEAKPEGSLAQKMADHFKVDVHAYLRRTFYGSVLREKSQSDAIVSSLKAARERQGNDLLVVAISAEHEALPHPGLADSGSSGIFGIGATGPIGEGTDNYALWRHGGGRMLPVAADTPKGLPAEMRVFKPKTK